MQRELAQLIISRLIGTPNFSRVGGLVQTVTSTEKGATGAPIRYPATFDVAPSAAGQAAAGYTDFVPNSAESGLLYVESGSLQHKGYTGGRFSFDSRLRLIGWLNTPDAATTLSIESTAVTSILRRLLPLALASNQGVFTRLTVTPGKILGVEDNLFSRYTYRESAKQYLLDPYTAFAIELTSTYQIHPHCLPSL